MLFEVFLELFLGLLVQEVKAEFGHLPIGPVKTYGSEIWAEIFGDWWLWDELVDDRFEVKGRIAVLGVDVGLFFVVEIEGYFDASLGDLSENWGTLFLIKSCYLLKSRGFVRRERLLSI